MALGYAGRGRGGTGIDHPFAVYLAKQKADP